MRAKPIDVRRLKEMLHYEPSTGAFTWLVTRCGKAKAGDIAGRVSRWGYRQIQIDGRLYMAHRLAWAYVHGDLPADVEIDHKNGQRDDNRLTNFRVATSAQNKQNLPKGNCRNKLGVHGVHFDEDRHKFRAGIKIGRKSLNLGSYDSLEAARAARLAAERRLHPFAQSNL